MARAPKKDILDVILEAHRKGQEQAIDLSIRTGVPLVVSKNGKIVEIKPKFKYVLVPIEEVSRTHRKRKKP